MKRQAVKILTSDLVFVGEIDNYESLIFVQRSQKVGEFELHINLDKNLTNTLVEDNFVYLDSKRVGVIRYREVDSETSEQLIIKGTTLQGLLNRRIMLPVINVDFEYETITGPLETVMKHYVIANLVNPTDPTRKVDNLVVLPDLKRGEEISWDARFGPIDENLETLATDTIGWNLTLDLINRQFIFDVLVGKNLSYNQSENNRVMFSVDFNNIKGRNFIDNALGYKNTAYVGGQGEGVDRLITEVGANLTGWKRIETFIDASDVEEDEELPTKGMERLKALSKIQSFESEILPYGEFVYGKDYNLGDTVTVRDKKLGLTLDTPIVEIRETFEAGGYVLEAVFGNTIPTLIDKIKQEISGPLIEKPFVPSKTTDLENDAGYITREEIAETGYDKTYIHVQMTPSDTWSVLHYLQKQPSVTVVDSGGNTVVGDIYYDTTSKIIIRFSSEFSGKAYLN